MRTIYWHQIAKSGQCAHVAGNSFTAPGGVNLHAHDLAEIYWLTGGEAELTVNGQSLGTAQGKLCLILPGDSHELRAPRGSQFSLMNIALPPKRFTSALASHAAELGTQPESIPRATGMDNTTLATLNRHASILVRHTDSPLAADRLLLDVFWMLHAKNPQTDGPTLPAWLARALGEIERPAIFTGGALAFARCCGKSPEHVARVCRKTLGETPADLINRARLRFAAQQLATTDRPILEISLDCGFHSLSHFYAVFKKRMNRPPRAYRLHHRGVLPSSG